jgi:hypothetical protein
MVKSATTDDEKMCLSREHHNYNINEIATSPYIRALCDVVQSQPQDEPSCLIFEWMDHDLRGVTAPEFRSNTKLPQAVSRGVLSALSVLKTLNAVHTGCDPFSMCSHRINMDKCQFKQHFRFPH